MELEDSKTGQSIRPLGAAAVTLLESLPREVGSSFVFPAERGDSYFQGTKRIWAKAIKKAKLPGVTPHTLRHTIGSTAISTGEALALTGAILGHSNPRSTAIYAHVQNDPSRRAANRVAKKIAAALAGNVSLSRNQKARPSDLETLVASLTDRLKAEGIDGARVQSIIADAIGAKH